MPHITTACQGYALELLKCGKRDCDTTAKFLSSLCVNGRTLFAQQVKVADICVTDKVAKHLGLIRFLLVVEGERPAGQRHLVLAAALVTLSKANACAADVPVRAGKLIRLSAVELCPQVSHRSTQSSSSHLWFALRGAPPLVNPKP